MSQLLSSLTFQPAYSQIVSATIQSSNDDYILAGRSFDAGSNSSAVAVRVHPNGNLVWEKIYSDTYAQFFTSIAELTNGTLIATGTRFTSDKAGDEQLWVVNLDPNGQIIWQNVYGAPNYQVDGHSVAATSDGGFIIAGLSMEHGGSPATVVMKFDNHRNIQWQKTFNGGVAFAVRQTANGGYILSGAHNIPGSLNSNPYALRLDASGNTLWESTFANYQVYVLLQSDIVETARGSFLMVAKSVVMEIDAAGRLVWAKQSGNLTLGSVAQLSDGTFAIAGGQIANYFDHAYVAVIAPNGGSILWDNAELLYPSGIGQVLINNDGFVTTGGYAPLNSDQSIMLLASYYHATSLGEIPHGAALSAAADIN